jgi:hypothetical protein
MNDAVARGHKLLHLYRRGVGGERQNAGRLLTAHLRTHDLTLYDLDRGLPVSQDLAVLDGWRESALWMARLGTEPEAVLTALVDAEDLTPAELGRLIASVDLDKLLGARLDGWAYAEGAPPELYRQAASQVRAGDLSAPDLSGSLAQRFQAAARLALFRQTHPERTLRTQGATEQAFVLGIVEGLTGQSGETTEDGVRARLTADQLARLRALVAEHGSDAREVARQAAQAYGKSLR